MSLTSPGKLFRQLVATEKPLQCVGAINAYHARLAQASGFKSLYISGGGVAAGSSEPVFAGVLAGVLAGVFAGVVCAATDPTTPNTATAVSKDFNIISTIRLLD